MLIGLKPVNRSLIAALYELLVRCSCLVVVFFMIGMLKMKNSLLVAALVALTLTACGKKEEAPAPAPAPAAAADAAKK